MQTSDGAQLESKEQAEQLISLSPRSEDSTTDYQFDREFIIGIGNDNFLYEKSSKSWHYDFVMENDYNLQKYYALNRPPSQLQFYFDKEDLQRENEAPALLLTGIKIDGHIFVGTETSDIDSIKQFTYFKSIELQYFYMRYKRGAHFVFRSSHYLCGINYMRFVDENDNVHIIGKKERADHATFVDDDDEKNKTVKAYTSHIMYESGHFYITGILTATGCILGLQIVDINESEKHSDSFMYIYRMFRNQGVHLTRYSQYTHEIDYQDDPDSRFRRIIKYSSLSEQEPIHFENFICTEDAQVIDLFNRICEYVVNDDNPSYNVLSEYLEVIQICLDGDIEKIHSIMSVARFLNDIIQTSFVKYAHKLNITNAFFEDTFTTMLCHENQFKYVVKIQKYWNVLFCAAQFCRKIIHFTPSFNVYGLAFVDRSTLNQIRSIGTFITQCVLFFNLSELLFNKDIIEWDAMNKAFVLYGVVIIATVILLTLKQISAFIEFNKTFNVGSKKLFSSPHLLLSFLINFVMAILIVPLSFIIIIYSSDSLELVLNSVAALFVLELDDQLVDLQENDERSIYLDYISKEILIEKLLKSHEKFKNYDELVSYDWNFNFVYGIDSKRMILEFDDIYNVTKHALRSLTFRSGEYSPMYDEKCIITLQENYITFRLVNDSLFHIRLFYNDKHGDDAYWEFLLSSNARIIRRRIGKEGKFARLFTEDYEKEQNPMPSRGTWFHMKWDAQENGFMECYYNNMDADPTLESSDTVLLWKYPYDEFVKKESDNAPLGKYDTLQYLQIYAFANPVKICFYK